MTTRLPAGNRGACRASTSPARRSSPQRTGQTRSAAGMRASGGRTSTARSSSSAMRRPRSSACWSSSPTAPPSRRWCSASPSASSARRNRRRRSPANELGLPFITLHGRRGGSAMAAAALNALILGDAAHDAVALHRRHRRGRARRPLARRAHADRHGRGADRRRAPSRHGAGAPDGQRAPRLALAARGDWSSASLAMRGRRVCVLATGDPMHFGIGATLAAPRPAGGDDGRCRSVSAFSLAAARLAWPLDERDAADPARPAGRAARAARPPGARLLILAQDATHAGRGRGDGSRRAASAKAA